MTGDIFRAPPPPSPPPFSPRYRFSGALFCRRSPASTRKQPSVAPGLENYVSSRWVAALSWEAFFTLKRRTLRPPSSFFDVVVIPSLRLTYRGAFNFGFLLFFISYVPIFTVDGRSLFADLPNAIYYQSALPPRPKLLW